MENYPLSFTCTGAAGRVRENRRERPTRATYPSWADRGSTCRCSSWAGRTRSTKTRYLKKSAFRFPITYTITLYPRQFSSQVKGEVSITVSEASPDNADASSGKRLTLSPPQLLTPKPRSRRGSFNFLQRRASARERRTSILASPRLLRRCSAREPGSGRREKPFSTTKEKDSLEVCSRPETNDGSAAGEVNILVTEPSPQSPIPTPNSGPFSVPAERRRAAFRQAGDSTVVQVLVHKESEEYDSVEHGS